MREFFVDFLPRKQIIHVDSLRTVGYTNCMLNFNSILLFSEDPKQLAAFYKKVFQKEPDMAEEGYAGFMVGSCFFTIGPHDKVKGKNAHPERVMLNFETKDVQKEFERIKELGTHVVQEPYHPGEMPDMWIATFSDPDGNYFQLMTPFEPGK